MCGYCGPCKARSLLYTWSSIFSKPCYIGVGIPDDWREGSSPEEEWQTVEIPDIELVVERAGKHHPHQVGGEQYQQHVCSRMRTHNYFVGCKFCKYKSNFKKTAFSQIYVMPNVFMVAVSEKKLSKALMHTNLQF